MRMAPRRGVGAHIDEALDAGLFEKSNELRRGAVTVPDAPESNLSHSDYTRVTCAIFGDGTPRGWRVQVTGERHIKEHPWILA